MDNVIPPLNTPQVSAPSADKNLTGTISGLTEQADSETILPGQSAMLEVLADARNTALKTLTGTVSLTLNGQLLKIPVELKLDTPLKLAADMPAAALELKLQPQKDGTVAAKVITVNGETPEKYMQRGNEIPSHRQADVPLIKNTAASLPQFETAPLKAGTLLENLPDLKGDVLDIGCGYGPIGIYVSKKNNLIVDMVDINKRSLALSIKNSKLNNVKTNVFESNLYTNINKKYDYIITNPPIRVGKKILYQLLFEAKNYLNKNGELWLVVNKDQGAKSLVNDLKKEYETSIICKNKGFFIIRAINN